jgi:hypothetical protein
MAMAAVFETEGGLVVRAAQYSEVANRMIARPDRKAWGISSRKI